MRYVVGGLGVAAVLYGAYLMVGDGATAPVAPAPVAPAPCPTDGCKPKPKPKSPWGNRADTARAADDRWPGNGVRPRAPFDLGASVGGPVSPDGAEINCDYPGERHKKNIASKGAGCCVFRSISHAADFQFLPALYDMPEWMVKSGIVGGGYPRKAAQLIERVSKERGLPTPEYFQIEAPAAKAFPLLRAACASGRMPCITYSRSPTGRYSGSRISHMVNLSHLDDKRAAVLDNNYVGYSNFEWMTPAELEKAASDGGSLWAIIFTAPGPPPPPYVGGKPKPTPQDWSPMAPRKKECPCSRECTCGCNQGHPCRCRPGREVYTGGSATDGVEWHKVAKNPSYSHNGVSVSYEDVMLAMDKVPDDVLKPRVTVVGPANVIAKVDADWRSSPALADARSRYVYRSYTPDHWHVKDYGFVLTASPAIHLTESDGKSLGCEEGYAGPEAMAGSLRRRDPNYPPPGGDKGPRGGNGAPLAPFAVVAGVAALLYVVTQKKKKEAK